MFFAKRPPRSITVRSVSISTTELSIGNVNNAVHTYTKCGVGIRPGQTDSTPMVRCIFCRQRRRLNCLVVFVTEWSSGNIVPGFLTVSGINLLVSTWAYLSSSHSGGVNMGFCDGRVQFVSNTMESKVIENLYDPADGE